VEQVGLHGAFGDEQPLGDLAVGQAVGGHAGHPALGRGQGVNAGQGPPAGTCAGGPELLVRVLGQGQGTATVGEVQAGP
jgi:hypothetical protein